MIQQIHIENFRGFKTFDCDAFAPVTIIGGENNCGKSSLLEALAVNAVSMMGNILPFINQSRSISFKEFKNLGSAFYNGNTDSSILVNLDLDNKKKRSVKISYVWPDFIEYKPQISSSTEILKGLNVFPHLTQEYSIEEEGKESVKGRVYLVENEKGQNYKAGIENNVEKLLLFWLNTHIENSFSEMVSKLTEIKKLPWLLEQMKMIDTSIKDIRLDEKKQVLVDLENVPVMLPIQIFGEGTLKIFNSFCYLAMAQNGILCIDEIENGLHHSVMEKYWENLLRVAKEMNVQIIATTHNLEMLQALAKTDLKETPERFSYINLVRSRKDGIVRAFPYTFEEFHYSMQENQEIR